MLNAQGTWESVDVPTNKDLNSLYFTDSLYGWIAGDSGTMIHTSDGGENWSLQDSPTYSNIMDVFFLNRNLGWATAFDFSELPYGTELLKTTDGGNNWSVSDYPEENLFMNCIFFLDSLNGWMGGSPHAIVKTTDGGITWTQADVDTSTLAFFPVLNIKFYNETYGYASGGIFDIAGVTWHTKNGGQKWYAINPSEAPADEVHGLHLFDSVRVIGSGGDPDFGYGVGMLRTQNGGDSWSYEEVGIQGIAYDIDFRNENEAWSPLGNRKKFIYSTDGGNSWTETDTPGSTAIFDVQFTDSLHGFAAGKEGAVLKYVDPVTVSIGTLPEPKTDLIRSFWVAPNPFNSFTVIGLEVAGPSISNQTEPIHIEISLFNLSGIEVHRAVDETYLPGSHQIGLDGSELEPGIYLIRLISTSDRGKVIALFDRVVKI